MSLRSSISAVGRRLMPGFVRRSYLAKFGAALLVVVVCIGAVGAVTYTETSSQLQERSQSEFTTAAELSSSSVSEWRAERTNNARMLAQYGVLEDGQHAEIREFLRGELDTLPADVRNLHYVNFANQDVVASTDESLQGERLNGDDTPWSEQGVAYGENGVFVSEPYVKDGATRVAYVASIDTELGRRSAVVMTTSLTAVTTNFRKPTEGSFTQLVGGKGSVVADDSEVATMQPYVANGSSPVVGATETGFLSAGSVAKSLESDHVVAYAPVEGTPWVVALHVPTSEAYALQSTVSENVLLMLGVALAGLGFIGLTLGRGTVTALNVLERKAEALERGEYDTDLSVGREDEIGGLFASFASLRDTVQERIREAEEQQEAAEQARSEAETAQAEAEEARRKSEQQARELEETAGEFSAAMAAYAAGDLTVRLDEDVDQAAMADVAASFNEMAADMEATVADVVAFADEVAAASDEASARAETVEQTGREVSAAVDRISDRTGDQRDQLEGVAGETDEMSATIQEVAASADEVAETSQSAAALGDDGREAASEAVAELQTIETETERTAEAVRELESRMAEIEEIVDVITDIAEQTNMLALNANIEAARADQSGDGFAVVADEVKDLADETKESAAEIEALVAEVREQTDESVTAMDGIQERVGDGVETVEATEDALSDIVARIEEADTGVQEISRAMDDQASSVTDVAAAVDDVVGLGEETADEAEQAAADADEQAETLGEVTEQTRTLSDRAAALREQVAQFEVDTDDEGESGRGEESADSVGPDASFGADVEEARTDGFDWQD